MAMEVVRFWIWRWHWKFIDGHSLLVHHDSDDPRLSVASAYLHARSIDSNENR